MGMKGLKISMIVSISFDTEAMQPYQHLLVADVFQQSVVQFQ
jgi:hypothetical protein